MYKSKFYGNKSLLHNMLVGATSFLRELCVIERDVRLMYNVYWQDMTKKKLTCKPLILLLQYSYMFQFYVL